MDEIVKQAMAKWPNVPDCYGWLGLDARGNWYMRDDAVQAVGAFDGGTSGSKGSLLQHGKLIDFIARNYAADARGCWYFQNGPQRVFVELQSTPLIWRLQPDGTVHDHIGRPTTVQNCWLDEVGHLYLLTDMGFGLVHTQDVHQAADAVVLGLWQPQDVLQAQLQTLFGYVKSPEALSKQ
jgi:hypothetical protein